jgi:AcrR family transcriptional regulator
MPRVSDQHLAARRQQILDAATRCFMRNGFHQTSMQDVINEAGLSVGAFYRYFKSKTDLIRAIAMNTVGGLVREFDRIVDQEPLPPLTVALRQALDTAEQRADREARIAVQVWGESLRDPELAALVGDMYRTIRERFVTLAARARDAGQLPPDTDPEAVGPVLFGLLQGYLLQRILVGQLDVDSYVAGVTALLPRSSAPASGTLVSSPSRSST